MPVNVGRIGKSNLSINNEIRIEPNRVVDYEQHSKVNLGVVLREKKSKWVILNIQGAEVEMSSDRLYLYPADGKRELNSISEKKTYLTEISTKAQSISEKINLEETWELIREERKEFSTKELTEIALNQNSLINHLAVRRTLLSDRVYFKRGKNGFEPRNPDAVKEMKLQVKIEEEKKKKRLFIINSLIERLKSVDSSLPDEISLLEETAAKGKSYERSEEAKEIIDEVAKTARLELPNRLEDRAFELLVRLKHFTPDQNLAPIRLGRKTFFSPEILEEADKLCNINLETSPETKNLKNLFTVTIDGSGTRDFDDAISCEQTPNGYRFGIHISDVRHLLENSLPLFDEAIRRGTSIYLPDELIPMLPSRLSEGVLSLVSGKDRKTMSFFIETNQNLEIINRTVCLSIINVSKRFTYESVDAILTGGVNEEMSDDKNFLEKLWQFAAQSDANRLSKGAIQFSRSEMIPRVSDNGRITLEENSDETPARKLVSEMMILANETAALFAAQNNIPLIFRSQEEPEHDPYSIGAHLPEGPAREYLQRGALKRSVTSTQPLPHYGLSLKAYAQLTSPIRRAADLINQIQLAKFISQGAPAYDHSQMEYYIAAISTGLDEAQQILRERNRYWLLKYLIQEKIKQISGTVIRTDGAKPLIQLDVIHSIFPFYPKAAGSSGYGAQESLLEKTITVRIESIDPKNGHLVLREI